MNKKTEDEIKQKGCRGCGRHQDEKPSDCSELFCLWDYGGGLLEVARDDFNLG